MSILNDWYPSLPTDFSGMSREELGTLANSVNEAIMNHHAQATEVINENWSNPYAWRDSEFNTQRVLCLDLVDYLENIRQYLIREFCRDGQELDL